MGNRQTRQQLIQDKSYVTQLPRDIQCMITERLNDYDDVMVLYQLYPQLRDVLYSCVRELFSNREIVWNAKFFSQWVALERTNIIVVVKDPTEMMAIASLPNLRTHRVMLKFNPLDKRERLQNEETYGRHLSFNHIHFIKLFDDYISHHLLTGHHTEELILIPLTDTTPYYDLPTIVIVGNGFCFTYISDYGGYIYINDNHYSNNIRITGGGLVIDLYSSLLKKLTGQEDMTDDSYQSTFRILIRPDSITRSLDNISKLPRVLTFRQIIHTSEIRSQLESNLEIMIRSLAIDQLCFLININDPIGTFGFFSYLLHTYPKITSFRLADTRYRGITLDTLHFLSKPVRDFPYLLERAGTLSQSLSLDISPKFKYHQDEYQHLVNAIPHLNSYTFYRFNLGDILFFLMRGIPVNFVPMEKLSPRNLDDMDRLQTQYPHFHIVLAKHYLIPEV